MPRCGNAENLKQTQKQRRIYAPRKRPRSRPRALTLPLSSPNHSWNPFKKSVVQCTLDQSQSTLFAKLPAEIRHTVWTKFLGGHLLHICRAPKRLLAIACAEPRGPQLATWHHWCWGSTSDRTQLHPVPGWYLGPRNPCDAEPANLVSLLRTCRRVYTEAIFTLYEQNVFDVNHLDTILYLHRSVLPQRLNQIRSVNSTWNFRAFSQNVPYDFGTWQEACHKLAALTSLQSLTLHLSGCYIDECYDGPGEPWKPLLDALRPVNAVQKFEVILPWSDEKCTEVAKNHDFPFDLCSEEPVEILMGPTWNMIL